LVANGRRRALITGAASGIGAAVARRLTEHGFEILLCDIDDVRGSALAGELNGTYQHLDVSDAGEWSALTFEPDVLVLNAGVVSGPTRVPLADLTDALWRRLRAVNVDGTMNGILRFVAGMAERGSGSIVVTSSLAGLVGYAGDPLYAATKHFSVGLVRSLAGLIQPFGVSINAVCPDATETAILNDDQRKDGNGLILDPDTVADAIVMVLGEQSTGDAWLVVSGRSPQPYRFGGIPAALNVAERS
jgi:NAD(P)-dependent dehydrogenase (short-subunit alcohol dehydrogenase family)